MSAGFQLTVGVCLLFMDNIQQIADLIVWASVQQGSTSLTRLRNELCSDSFHAVLALNCEQAKCQCCIATLTVMVVVYRVQHKAVDHQLIL